MRVLLIGSGGREHALAWSIASSPLLTKLWCAPGNPGIGTLAELVPIGATEIAALVTFAVEKQIDLVVPGPEAPIAAGITDAMSAAGIRCCGPTASAGQLESSKAFAHEVADAAGIATARWERFEDPAAARDFVARRGAPIVIKADGLAAGKGVVVAATEAEATAAIDLMMDAGAFGEAGRSVVIEECLTGPEYSVFALCDGTHAVPLGAACDHKRVGEGDVGPNTGGMGAYAEPGVTRGIVETTMDAIILPTLAEMARRGLPYRGILFAGLMMTSDGPRLIEFNARFGDPEAQTLLPLLRSDLLAALVAACDGELGNFDLRWLPGASVAVVVAARGYPGQPQTGGAIEGLETAASIPEVTLFHAATAAGPAPGQIVAAGGRVLTVVGTAPTIAEARGLAYTAVDAIRFRDGFCRRDIGLRAVQPA